MSTWKRLNGKPNLFISPNTIIYEIHRGVDDLHLFLYHKSIFKVIFFQEKTIRFYKNRIQKIERSNKNFRENLKL